MTELTPALLLTAYTHGVFPIAESRDDPTLYWLDPEMRGILPLDGFHVPRRLARTVRSDRFEVRIDTAFGDVMRACAEPRTGSSDSWINRQIMTLYGELYEHGYCHSVECWRDKQLVGGLYGVHIGAAFFGESMFARERDASKVALVHLVARLQCGGFRLLDTQFVTEHLTTFGAVEIPRDQYRKMLRQAIADQGDFYCLPDGVTEPLSGAEVMQSITQTS